MAKSADAADLKSADPQGLWGFKSPSGHQVCRSFDSLWWVESAAESGYTLI
jgi:hypothetical protein